VPTGWHFSEGLHATAIIRGVNGICKGFQEGMGRRENHRQENNIRSGQVYQTRYCQGFDGSRQIRRHSAGCRQGFILLKNGHALADTTKGDSC